MSIDASSNIIPSNIGGTLNQASQDVFVTKGRKCIVTTNTPADAPKTFADAYGNVLSSMKSLSATRYVKVGDTHGKSGFSALGQILSNIGHNIKALFAGNDKAERANLEKSVDALEKFAENETNKAELYEKENLKQLYQAVKSAKYEHIKDNKDNSSLFLQPAKKMDAERKKLIEQTLSELKIGILKNQKKYNKDDLAKSMEKGNFDLDKFAKNYGENFKKDFGENFIKKYDDYRFLKKTSFKDLALRTLSAVPGDKETLWAAYKNYVKLTNLVEGGEDARNGFMDSMNSSFFEELGKEMMTFKDKPLNFKNGKLKFEDEDLSPVSDPKPKTLADRIEVALKKIANNSGIDMISILRKRNV